MNPSLKEVTMNSSQPSSHQIIAAIDQLVSKVFISNIDISQLTHDMNKWYAHFINIYDEMLSYGSSINAYLLATQSLVNDLHPEDVIWAEKLTVEFVHELTRFYSQYQADQANHAHQETDNSYSLHSYLRELTTHHKRLLFIRVDLKYLDSVQNDITVWDFDYHMTRLTQRISNKKSCFRNLQGYAWALEQGFENGGLHCHLLLIYDGEEHQNSWYLAREVGEKWKKITDGQGSYFNCHDTKYTSCYEALGTLGIGMIHRNNKQEVENALRSASYLTRPTKYNQKLKAWLPRMRSFGHGTYRNTKRRGLPPIAK